MLKVGETSHDQSTCAERLAAIVGDVFPRLALTNRRVEQSGGDHIVLIVDEDIAFRFPRTGIRALNLEIAVLQRLQQRAAIATPAYRFVDPNGRFGGYALIAGTALTPLRFKALSPSRQDDILRTVALFLAELHGLSPEVVAPIGHWPSTWTASQFASRGLIEYLPAIACLVPEQARSLEAFYTRYAEHRPPARVVVHGDLVAEHILLDEDNGQLSGIIDFGDVALGDPAQDFLGFWTYGHSAAARAVELYQLARPDPGLLERSRDHFIRHGLDRLLGDVIHAGDAFLEHAEFAARIDALLAFECIPQTDAGDDDGRF